MTTSTPYSVLRTSVCYIRDTLLAIPAAALGDLRRDVELVWPFGTLSTLESSPPMAAEIGRIVEAAVEAGHYYLFILAPPRTMLEGEYSSVMSCIPLLQGCSVCLFSVFVCHTAKHSRVC